jgi:hypothetical protein
MTASKPENMKDEIWAQHLRWLDLVSNECKSNQFKRQREKSRKGGVRER